MSYFMYNVVGWLSEHLEFNPLSWDRGCRCQRPVVVWLMTSDAHRRVLPQPHTSCPAPVDLLDVEQL